MINVILLVLPIFLIGCAFIVHTLYAKELLHQIKRVSYQSFSKSDFMFCCNQSQGSNFNAIVIISWSLFLLCIACFFGLTHVLTGDDSLKLNISYIQIGSWFFLIQMLLMTVSIIFIPRFYGFYDISITIKSIIFYFAPLFLLSSILVSFLDFFGRTYILFISSYIFMLIGELLLLLPIFLAWRGVFRK
jgi:hypothetical protein